MYATLFDRPELVNEQLDRYLAVDAEAIRRVFRDTFRDDNRVVLTFVPPAEPAIGRRRRWRRSRRRARTRARADGRAARRRRPGDRGMTDHLPDDLEDALAAVEPGLAVAEDERRGMDLDEPVPGLMVITETSGGRGAPTAPSAAGWQSWSIVRCP